MRLVIVEHPYAGEVARNVLYARKCLRDCILRGEAPFASALLYAQPGILDDDKPAERELGIYAGLAWCGKADATVVYTDYDISPGMQKGIDYALFFGRPVEYRRLYGG